jgi:diguanylate cyclase (GGDEF)-like protein/PAS domain S-box-containing protein
MTYEESLNKIVILERRLQREKIARLAAESILEEKSKQVYQVNQTLIKAVLDLEKLTVAVEQSPIIVLISDVIGTVEYVNHSFSQMSGYTKDEVMGRDIRSLGFIIGSQPLKGIQQVMENKSVWKGDIQGLNKNKQEYKLTISISPILNSDNAITHLLYNCEDVTKQKENEEKIYKLAHHDSLTGLYNRFSINGILDQALSSAARNNSQLSVLFIDMDRFKQINDTHGHVFGDALLQQVAERLQAICRRKNDYLARVGGDEFLVVLNDIQDIDFCALTAQAILEVLSFPYEFEGQELRSSPSIGIAMYPHDGLISSELIKNADAAMYHVKNSGRRKYSFFTKELNRIVEEKNEIEKELRIALEQNKLMLFYQPQIYLGEEMKFGVEALLRWDHVKLGFVSPEKFISIAEERGLIYTLGSWVIDTAFQQLKDWLPVAKVQIKMAINLSAKQIEDSKFVGDLTNSVNKYQIDPTMIELEITESIAMKNPEMAINTLNELRAMGFEIAIDDFGTGYSSLAYLQMLPIQTLKLDKSFVENLQDDNDSAKICKASISLSHDLGLQFVAEGIETKLQAEFFDRNSCDVIQGYYFCRPIPANKAFEFMHQYQRIDYLDN